MKTLTYRIAIPFLALLFSCSAPKENPEDLKLIEQEILSVERAFSDYSEKNGFAKALAEFAADDVIKLSDKQHPTFGKAQLQKEAGLDSIGNNQGTITWKPLKVRVAKSGEMATTFGDWNFTFKSPKTSQDTILYGNYITVWVKQADGSWKYTLDGGNPAPGPTTDAMLELIK